MWLFDGAKLDLLKKADNTQKLGKRRGVCNGVETGNSLF